MSTPDERAEEAEAKVERQRDRLRSRQEQVRRLRAEVTRLNALVADLRSVASEFEDYEDNLAAQVLAARQGQDKARRKATRRKAERDALAQEVEQLRAATVKPDREAVARAIFDAEYPDIAEAERDAEWGTIAPADHDSAWHRQAAAVLALWPGRTEGEVRADERARIVTMLEVDIEDLAEAGNYALDAGVMRARRLVRNLDRAAAEDGADRE